MIQFSCRYLSRARLSRQVIPAFTAVVILSTGLYAAPAGQAAAVPVAGPQASPAPAHPAGPAKTQPAGPPPKFRCDEPEYKFGTVWATQKVEHTFIIHNDGEGVLTIQAKPTCGCTIAEYDKTVEPGGQGKVKTILSTGNYTTAYRKTINVTTNDPEKKMVPLTLSGEVKQKIKIELISANRPPIVQASINAYFGQLAPNLDLTKNYRLTNNTEDSMKLEVVPPAEPSCFKLSLKEVEPGKVAEVTVSAEPPFKSNDNSARFTIKTGLPDTPDMIVPCRLIKPPPVQVMPSLLRLPSVPLANQYRQRITVRNNEEDPLNIVSFECNDERIKLEKKENVPGKLYTIELELPVDYAPNPASQPVVTITTDYEEKPVYKVPLVAIQHRPTTQPVLASAESHVGRPAPSLTLPTLEGQQVRIGPGANRVTLVNFWAPWCSASRTQIPPLDRLYQTYRRKGVAFVNVNVEHFRPAEEVSAIVRELDTKIPVALDADQRVTKAFSISDVPTVFLIGKNGIVEAARRGLGRSREELDTTMTALEEQLDLLLEGKTRMDFPARPMSVGFPCRLQPSVSPAMAAAGPVLTVEAFRQDAGLFKPKSTGHYKVYFRNNGSQPLEIKEVKPSNGLTIDPSYPKTLGPRATAFLECSFETPSQPIPFVHQVLLQTNDRSRPMQSVAITGRSLPYVEVQPETGIDFSDRVRTFTVPRIATLMYHGPGQVEYKEPKSSSPKFQAEIRPTRQPTCSIITVKALPPFDQGETRATIVIETNQSEQPVVHVPVKLTMPERIEVRPAEIDLTPSPSSRQISVRLINSGEAPFKILEVNKSKPEIEADIQREPDKLSYKLQVTIPGGFVCGPEGERITIRTDDKEYGEIVIPIRTAGGRARPAPPSARLHGG